MEDLTQGSIPKHLIRMAIPMAIGMLVNTLFLLIDLYFVGQLGEHSLAGVSAAANISMLVLALTQMLNVGTGTLIAHAAGAKDQEDANLIFNQALVISTILILLTVAIGYGLADIYMHAMSEDSSAVSEGKTYLYWYVPGLALQFSMVAMSAAMRGTGIVKPAMKVQMLSVLLNILLTPILVNGWVTGYAMGVAGAGLASTLSMLFAVVLLWRYFMQMDHFISVKTQYFAIDITSWKRLFKIGFPAGGEFFLLFAYMALVYWSIQGFGANATAGFGLGSRVMQALFLPAMALAFALPAVAGQNFGAKLPQRVKDSFKWSVVLSSILMGLLIPISLLFAGSITSTFSEDVAVLAVATGFLSIICFNFIPSGIIFCCSGAFQGIGNTWPSLISTGTRLITFAIPLIWLTQQDRFYIEQVWQLSVGTVLLQMLLSLFFVKREFSKRLNFK